MEEKRETKIKTKGERGYNGRVKLSKKQVARESVLGIGFGILGFLLGRCEMLFGTYPLGFALLAVSSRQVPYVLLGVIGSCFSEDGISVINLSAALLTVVVRIICRFALDKPQKSNLLDYGTLPDKIGLIFSENLYLKMMSGAIGVFFVGIYNIVLGGFRFYDLFGSVFYVIIVPVAVFLYDRYFVVRERVAAERLNCSLQRSEERLYDLACAALICSLIYSLRDTVIAGLSLPVFLAFFLTLYYSGKSFLKGIIMGLLFGLATGPIYAPLYAFGAIACASLRSVSVFAASLSSCVVGLIWGIYVGGALKLAVLFPALLSSSMVYCAAERIKIFSDVSEFFSSDAVLEESCALGMVADTRARASAEKMRGISDSFSALSEIFYNLSSKLKRPAMLDLRRICDKTFDGYCPDCDEYEVCFGAEYPNTLEQMKRLAVQLHSSGRADGKKLNESFRGRCLYCDKIVEEVNEECARETKRALRNEKTEIFALDYDAISRILNDAISENEEEYKPDRAMGKKLSAAIAAEGYGAHTVMVWGTRRKRILAKGLDLSENAGGVEHLRRKLERVSGFQLDEPEFELAFGSVNMRVSSRRAFDFDSAFAVSPSADGGEFCGDTVSVFENKNGYAYALISDGMGTGQTAAFTSEMCSVFLRNMLMAGNHTETSLRMLNSVVRAKSNSSATECSATVDLLELDLYGGSLNLIKSGAAPTYLLREGNVFKLAGASAPIGILRSIDAKRIQMNCRAGDLIVMVSDGITRGGEDCLWLSQMLTEEYGKDKRTALPVLAEKIVERAKNEDGADDVSALVIRLDEAKS